MITVWPSLYRPREGQTSTDLAILARAAAPREYLSKDAVPRWSGATFRGGHRALATFDASSWVVLDYDAGGFAVEAFADLCGFAHTSWSHTPEAPRWRVAVMLSSRLGSVGEHDRVWRAAAAIGERAGLEPDRAARTACHCFALPAARPGYRHVALTGALLDVDAALEEYPAPAPLPVVPLPDVTDYAGRLERASKYLATMPGALSGSGGSATTFKAAAVLVRDFGLSQEDALRLMVEEYNPKCAPPWTIFELRHKVRSAFQRGQRPFGAIVDRRRSG
jgi:hypothetical protein